VSTYSSKGISSYYIPTPKLSSAQNTASGIKVTWNKVSTATSYNIYRKKKGVREGFAEPTKKIEIDKKEAKRGFFRPIIIVHIVVSVLLALMILALAIAYPYLT
jgi:hypothetical protein